MSLVKSRQQRIIELLDHLVNLYACSVDAGHPTTFMNNLSYFLKETDLNVGCKYYKDINYYSLKTRYAVTRKNVNSRQNLKKNYLTL